MTSGLDQQLKQDGQAIKQQAQSRLDQWDVSESVMQSLADDNRTPAKSWWYGLAAATVLTVMIWAFNFSDSVSMDRPHSNQQAVIQPFESQLKKLPLELEQKINQPLLDEQQAIIQDLKSLSAQLLSI